MTGSVDDLWEQYLDAEQRGLRASSLTLLENFLSAIDNCTLEFRRDWVEALAQRVADKDSSAVVRFPLFNRLVGPVLVGGVLAGRPASARLLSTFDQFLYAQAASGLVQLPDSLHSVEALLIEALRVAPDDSAARNRLVENRARYLSYTLHEIPSGVLYGHDGASISECDELLTLLDEFVSDTRLLQKEHDYADLVSRCRFHYAEYRKYLESPFRGRGYSAYLQRGSGA